MSDLALHQLGLSLDGQGPLLVDVADSPHSLFQGCSLPPLGHDAVYVAGGALHTIISLTYFGDDLDGVGKT